MADRVTGILRNLRIKRVALVDNGANLDPSTGDGAHIMLYKRADPAPDPAPPIPTTNKETNVAKTIKSVFKSFLAAINEPDVAKRTAAATALATEIDSIDEPVAKAVHNADDAMCKCDTCMAKRADLAKIASDKDKADLEKAVGIEVAKRVDTLSKANEDLAKQNKDLAASVAKMQEQTADTEMVTILKGFKATPFKLDGPDSDVVKFRTIKAANPAAWDRMLEVFKATDAQLATSKAFDTIGSGLRGGGDAWAQIEAKADQLMEKSTSGNLTREQAIEKVSLANPALVRQHRAEQNRAS